MVGKELVKLLLVNPEYTKLTLLSRRELTPQELEYWPKSPKLNIKLVNFDKIEESFEQIKGHNVAFCTLGTTKAEAGSNEKFIKIDHDIPLNSAKVFLEANPDSQFMLLTSQGANSQSWFFYLKTKGQLEDEIKEMNFKQVSIFRPGLLVYEGSRKQSRFMEGVMVSLAKTFGLGNSAGCSTIGVAKAMELVSMQPITDKIRTFENAEIVKLSQ